MEKINNVESIIVKIIPIENSEFKINIKNYYTKNVLDLKKEIYIKK